MPTTLPPRRRSDAKRARQRAVFDIAFNGALLVSALILAFVVLLREEQYALGQTGELATAIEQTTVNAAGEGINLPLD